MLSPCKCLSKRFKTKMLILTKSCTKEHEPDGIAWTVYDADGLIQVKQQIRCRSGWRLFYGQTFQRMGTEFDLEAENSSICI